MKRVQQYIDDVLSGKRIAGEYEKLFVQRHLNDLKKQRTKKFPYYFDEGTAQYFLDAAPLFPFTKGSKAGQPFELEPWQAFFIALLYGWKREEDDFRRFNKFYIKVARKNGKTELMYLVGMFGLTIDAVPGGEIYWAATKTEQSKIGWERMRMGIDKLRRTSEYFANHVSYYLSHLKIYNTANNVIVRPLARDSKTEDGQSPSHAIIDEYHAHPDSSMLDLIESGTGSQDQPIVGIITTAGFNTGSPCKNLEDRYKRILKGEIDNEEVLVMIFDLDKDDDWQDEACWPKANPSIGTALKMRFLKSEFQKAMTEGAAKEMSFKTKNLNIWTNTSVGWVNVDRWMELAADEEDLDLSSMRCFAGFDYAEVRDTSCLCLLFTDGGKFFVKPFFFIPEENAKERQKIDKVAYLNWEQEGHIKFIPGNVIDPQAIKEEIAKILKCYNVEAMTYDRWKATEIIRGLEDDGFECIGFGQGYASMSHPTKELERMILSDQDPLLHDGNSVMTWQLGNVNLALDPSANVKIVKRRDAMRVDGPVAMVMAYGCYLIKMAERDEEPEELIYIL